MNPAERADKVREAWEEQTDLYGPPEALVDDLLPPGAVILTADEYGALIRAGDRLLFVLDHCSSLDIVAPVTLADITAAKAEWMRLK